jgi:hypothetical protein
VTLILSYATPWFALQVSDRLVTDSATRDPLDPSANKAIVLLASNGLVALGYSGLAVIGSGTAARATDHWLVEQIVKAPVGGGLSMGDRGRKFDLGYAVKAICTALDDSPYIRAKRHVEIAMCGFQWKRPALPQHVSSTIAHNGRRYVDSQTLHRARDANTWLTLSVVPDYDIDGDRLVQELSEWGSDPDKAEALLVETIKSAARDSYVIGSDSTSLLIATDGAIRVRYDGRRQVPATPTPWFVTPHAISSPLLASTPELSLGGLPVKIDLPATDAIEGDDLGGGRKRYRIPVFTTEPRKWGPRVEIPPIPDE